MPFGNHRYILTTGSSAYALYHALRIIPGHKWDCPKFLTIQREYISFSADKCVICNAFANGRYKIVKYWITSGHTLAHNHVYILDDCNRDNMLFNEEDGRYYDNCEKCDARLFNNRAGFVRSGILRELCKDERCEIEWISSLINIAVYSGYIHIVNYIFTNCMAADIRSQLTPFPEGPMLYKPKTYVCIKYLYEQEYVKDIGKSYLDNLFKGFYIYPWLYDTKTIRYLIRDQDRKVGCSARLLIRYIETENWQMYKWLMRYLDMSDLQRSLCNYDAPEPYNVSKIANHPSKIQHRIICDLLNNISPSTIAKFLRVMVTDAVYKSFCYWFNYVKNRLTEKIYIQEIFSAPDIRLDITVMCDLLKNYKHDIGGIYVNIYISQHTYNETQVLNCLKWLFEQDIHILNYINILRQLVDGNTWLSLRSLCKIKTDLPIEWKIQCCRAVKSYDDLKCIKGMI